MTLGRHRVLVVASLLAVASFSLVGCATETSFDPAANDSPSDSGDQWSEENVRATCERGAENSEMSVEECFAAIGSYSGS